MNCDGMCAWCLESTKAANGCGGYTTNSSSPQLEKMALLIDTFEAALRAMGEQEARWLEIQQDMPKVMMPHPEWHAMANALRESEFNLMQALREAGKDKGLDPIFVRNGWSYQMGDAILRRKAVTSLDHIAYVKGGT